MYSSKVNVLFSKLESYQREIEMNCPLNTTYLNEVRRLRRECHLLHVNAQQLDTFLQGARFPNQYIQPESEVNTRLCMLNNEIEYAQKNFQDFLILRQNPPESSDIFSSPSHEGSRGPSPILPFRKNSSSANKKGVKQCSKSFLPSATPIPEENSWSLSQSSNSSGSGFCSSQEQLSQSSSTSDLSQWGWLPSPRNSYQLYPSIQNQTFGQLPPSYQQQNQQTQQQSPIFTYFKTDFKSWVNGINAFRFY